MPSKARLKKEKDRERKRERNTSEVGQSSSSQRDCSSVLQNFENTDLLNFNPTVVLGGAQVPIAVLDTWSIMVGILPPTLIYQLSLSQDDMSTFEIPATTTGTQIHYIDSHYVVSHQENGCVTIYDTIFSSSRIQRLQRQLNALYPGVRNNTVKVHYIHAQDQGSTNDCGVFAAAYALHLLLGHNPIGFKLNQALLRPHMYQCLLDKSATEFPMLSVRSYSSHFSSTDGPTIRPSTSTNSPTNRPSTSTNRPSTSTNSPTNRPSTSTNRPSTSTNRPSTSTNRPSTSTNSPSNRPSTSTNSPSNRPSTSTNSPSNRPSTSTKRPSTSTNRPSTSTNSPSNRPSTSTNSPSNRPSSKSSMGFTEELHKYLLSQKQLAENYKQRLKQHESEAHFKDCDNTASCHHYETSRKAAWRQKRNKEIRDEDKQKARARMKSVRSRKSAEERDEDQQKARARMASLRSMKSAEEKDEDKQKARTHKASVRSMKSAEERDEDKQKARTRMESARSMKSAEKRDEDKQKARARMESARSRKSAEERDEDKQKDKARKESVRSMKSAEERDEDKQKDKARKESVRSMKSTEERDEDKQKDKARKENVRKNMSLNEKCETKHKERRRKQLSRLCEKQLNEKPASDSNLPYLTPAVVDIIQKFEQAIKRAPTFVCISCHRCLYRESVVHFILTNYSNNTKRLISGFKKHENNMKDTEWICQTCHKSLKKGKLPSQAEANNLSLVDIPHELGDLSPMEVHIITRIIPFMKIVSKPRGAQHGIHGQVVLVPTDLSKVTTMLPRVSSDSGLILLSLKRRLTDIHSVQKHYIRPHAVNRALDYLREHNPMYSNVIFNNRWVEQSLSEDPSLWKSLAETDSNVISDSDNDEKEASPCSPKKESIHSDQITDSEDEVENDIPKAVQNELHHKRSLNTSTCLLPQDGPTVKALDVVNIAPGEGQRPVSVSQEPQWEAMAFPRLFPDGMHTFNTERRVKLTAKKYVNARLLNADGRFGECCEYLFSSLQWLQTLQLQSSISIALRKSPDSNISVRQIKDTASFTSLLTNDNLFATFKSLRGSPMFWQQMQLDMLAKLRQLGPYTFFLTGSCAEFHWTEVINAVAQQYGHNFSDAEIEEMDWNTKRHWLQRNPVTAARQIHYIFEQLWSKVILSGPHPIGEILNYDKRKEMQGRGTEHFHAALHVKGAPRLDENSDEEVIQFIDKHISCAVPDERDPLLRSLVLGRQVHHHTRTCKKNKKTLCRFSFPRSPSRETLIARPTSDVHPDNNKQIQTLMKHVYVALLAMNPNEPLSLPSLLQQCDVDEDSYHKALQISTKRSSIVLQRKTNEINVNNYNPILLRALKANMDIQFITNIWACIAYITSYMCKPERGMSELMKKASKEASDKTLQERLYAIGNVFHKAQEVSQHEAVSRVLSLPLRKSNTAVVFVPTDYKDKRTRILKPISAIKAMKDDNGDVFAPSMLDKYAARPPSLSNKCLADFAANYKRKSTRDEDDEEEVESDETTQTITLQNNLGKLVKRKRPCVIRYHYVSKLQDSEQYYHRLLLLYKPWHSEEELKLGNSYEAKFKSVKDEIEPNVKVYEPYCEEVDDILENFDPNEPLPEDAWNLIASEVEHDRQHETTEYDSTFSFIDPDHLTALSTNHSSSNKTPTRKDAFLIDTARLYMSNERYYDLVKSLNKEQRHFFDFVLQWATNTSLAGNSDTAPDPFYVFLSGGAGVGKSHVINTIYQAVTRALASPHKDADKPTVLLTATTGKAASNISGTTLHSAFSLPIRDNNRSGFTKPSAEKLNTLRTMYVNLKLLIIDEISMLGATTLQQLSFSLQHIFERPGVPFGGLSVLAVGDLLQINPVGDKPVFKHIAEGYEVFSSRSLWEQKFQLYELVEIVRQRDDLHFAQILSRMRVGELTNEDLQDLSDLEHTNTDNFATDAMHLFLTNAQVHKYNDHQLQLLGKPVLTIRAVDSKKDMYTQSSSVTIQSKNLHDTGGLPSELSIAEGCRWMLTKNIDLSDKLVNGATGTVVAYSIDPAHPLDGRIYIHFDDDHCGLQAKKQSPQHLSHCVPIRAVTARFPLSRTLSIPVERKQYPGMLAFALTVHKSQGSTYPYVVGDLSCVGKTPMPPGLTYTMLSRCPTRAGLHLVNFSSKKVVVNQSAKTEMERMRSQSYLNWTHPLDNLQSNNVSCGTLNIRSLPHHFEDLHAHRQLHHMSVLGLTETRCPKEADGANYALPEHTMYLKHTTHGLGLAVKNDLSVTNIPSVQIPTDLQAMAYYIGNDELTIVVLVYRPPRSRFSAFLTQLQSLLDQLPVPQHSTVLMGDFNTTGPQLDQLTNSLSRYDLVQRVSSPTHAAGGTLDLLFTTSVPNTSGTFPVPYSDHHIAWAIFM